MSLFNLLIHTSTFSTEKLLMVDITALREAFQLSELSEVGWGRSGHDVAVAMSKPGNCGSLDSFFNSGTLPLYVAQWMVREEANETHKELIIVRCPVIPDKSGSRKPLPRPYCLFSPQTRLSYPRRAESPPPHWGSESFLARICLCSAHPGKQRPRKHQNAGE